MFNYSPVMMDYSTVVMCDDEGFGGRLEYKLHRTTISRFSIQRILSSIRALNVGQTYNKLFSEDNGFISVTRVE